MRLSEFRAKAGLTQQQLAEALGLSKSRVCEIESGSPCSLATALKIEVFSKGAVRPSELAAAPQRRKA
jgi:DNA-binding XRE family transcriptional regulator